ncbi:MAG: ion channel [Rickettsiales bacterium]
MSFILISLLSVLIILTTSFINYKILSAVWKFLPHLHVMPRFKSFLIIIPIFSSHIINIWLYAIVYLLIESFTDFGTLTGNIDIAAFNYESFIERVYFSASTYTSLGLGDIRPTKELRMITSAEVLNGLVMIGWTVSFTYLAMEKTWFKESDK